jgi:hypothetical protein
MVFPGFATLNIQYGYGVELFVQSVNLMATVDNDKILKTLPMEKQSDKANIFFLCSSGRGVISGSNQ